MTWIQTRSGLAVDLLAPSAAAIRLDDIAYALSHMNRFTGHAGPFSVAQHSVNCMLAVAHADPNDYELQLGALLHDAHEAYTGDISTPMKSAVGLELPGATEAIRRIQARHDEAIAEWAGIDPLILSCDAVKHVDRRMLATEKRQLMGKPPRPWTKRAEPYKGVDVSRPWRADQSEYAFTKHVERLQRLRGRAAA